ncbi:DUF1801 domain-containing protein [Roseisolibacter sp. H3M3-2]|uniref:DUF1801 domain-containing protein n=1 Tax=Roseisolibacter sp. H3M3-2 TaxID=3031323 RepID=UPI0023DC18CB|nr:DUF1801 domain-containing protein [Roseisolibacter sp. H3M3-2]MDF1504509.1 DUF1801 domain-containing protein [Roseisolibacter sp. H3M3-2]
MARSAATTADEYLAELPAERRALVGAARDLVRAHLPAGYREMMSFGMICWGIPLADYPDTYNGQPLCYAALASQKQYVSLYLMGVAPGGAEEGALRDAYAAAGKKLDLGKSCLRFKRWDDLVPEAVARVVAATPPAAFVAAYEASRRKK